MQGELGGKAVDVMLDSGSSVSLVESGILTGMKDIVSVRCARSVRLVTASGDQLPILRHIRACVELGEFNVMHDFVVVDSCYTSNPGNRLPATEWAGSRFYLFTSYGS